MRKREKSPRLWPRSCFGFAAGDEKRREVEREAAKELEGGRCREFRRLTDVDTNDDDDESGTNDDSVDDGERALLW